MSSTPRPGASGISHERLFDPGPEQPLKRRHVVDTPRRVANVEQFKLFMTPREIMSQYGPSDGDREYMHIDSAEDPYDEAWVGVDERYETDEELWSRKVDEAKGYSDWQDWGFDRDPWGIYDKRAGEYTLRSQRTDGEENWDAGTETSTRGGRRNFYIRPDDNQPMESLYDSIAREGVRSPVTLAYQHGGQRTTGNPEYQKRDGADHLPSIIGGHHRVASAMESRPDEYIPVLYNEDVWSAKSDRNWKYT